MPIECHLIFGVFYNRIQVSKDGTVIQDKDKSYYLFSSVYPSFNRQNTKVQVFFSTIAFCGMGWADAGFVRKLILFNNL